MNPTSSYLSSVSLHHRLLLFAGQIDAAEIQDCLRSIGVNISLEEATRILLRSVILHVLHIDCNTSEGVGGDHFEPERGKSSYSY